jgi:ATP phosphoribosyltransferase regulatory subunit
MSNRILHVPYGTADILPGEAAARRKMEDSIAATFAAWGFEEVATPTFEYLATFGGGGRVSDSNFKFFDRQNNTLMLRTDMTAPIARLVATRLQGEPGVKRLSYRAQLFRYEEAQSGRQCEFTQAGIEMMGEAGPAADAEVIALAVTALQEAGLTHFTLSVGQVALLTAWRRQLVLMTAQLQKFKHCLITHNAVGLKKLVQEQHLTGPLAKSWKNFVLAWRCQAVSGPGRKIN